MTKNQNNDGLITVIMAAGQGTRMRSDLVKVLHPLGGRPLIQYVVETAIAIHSNRILVIIGYQGEAVRDALEQFPVEFVTQKDLLGTGHAVMQAEPFLSGFTGDLLVLAGDTPLVRPGSLDYLVSQHRSEHAAVTLLTARMENPYGLGRIIRGPDGQVARIVEENDASSEEKLVREVNTSVYCFQAPLLLELLGLLKPQNQQKEYYLTDTIALMADRNLRIRGIETDRPQETVGINTPEQLEAAETYLKGHV